MVYEWKTGSRIKANAQKVGEELEKIPVKTAEKVVEAASKRKNSELHKCFTWDDSKAAQEYRLEQARLVLRAVVTVVDVNVGGQVETVKPRAFESIRMVDELDVSQKSMVYVPTKEALTDDFMRAQVIGRLRDTIGEAEHTVDVYLSMMPELGLTKGKLKEAKDTLEA